MKLKSLGLVLISVFSLSGCTEKTPGPDYGVDFNTPEFFLARMNPQEVKVSVSGLKYYINDSNGDVKSTLFEMDDFTSIEPTKSKSKQYVSYYTLLEASMVRSIYAEMLLYTDGIIRIDYKESGYKKTSFYHSLDKEEATKFYTYVEDKISKEIEVGTAFKK